MVIAVALAHIGSVRARRAPDDLAKYRRMLVWNAASLAVILAGIPWWRPCFPGPGRLGLPHTRGYRAEGSTW